MPFSDLTGRAFLSFLKPRSLLSPSEEREKLFKICTLLGMGAEFSGIGGDLFLYLLGKTPYPIYPTTLLNLLCALLFFISFLLSFYSYLFSVRFLCYSSLLLCIPGTYLIGAISEIPVLYIAFPLLIGGFFIGTKEEGILFLLSLLLWLFFYSIEKTYPPLPVERSPFFREGYIVAGLTSFFFTTYLLFSFNLSREETLTKREAENRSLIYTLSHKTEELEKAISARNQFLTSISHELRTPLASLVGILDIALLNRDKITEEHIKTAYSASVHTLRIVENLLDLNRIQQGELSPHWGEIYPIPVIESVVKMMKVFLHPKNKMELFLGNLPERVIGDEGKIRRALMNILSNAVRAVNQTEGGIIVVRGYLQEEPSNASLVVEIHDTGPGFNPQKVKSGEQFRPSPQGGMGLGLRITEELLRSMKGKMTIDSSPGKGARVTLTIPVQIPSGPPPSPPQRKVLKNLRILIVDDHPEILEVFRLYCEEVGCTVEVAENVEKAIGILKEKEIDYILLDLLMPDISGEEALLPLRQVAMEKGTPLKGVFALTAHVRGDDENILKVKGFDGFIPKPISLEDFHQRLLTYLRNGQKNQ